MHSVIGMQCEYSMYCFDFIWGIEDKFMLKNTGTDNSLCKSNQT